MRYTTNMLQAGLVGLPNVGKSTLFNALLTRQVAEAANYPFCTIEPNVGVVEVPDERLTELATIVSTQTIVPAAIEFVDIAGLVEGAHKGEGLGNQFLSNIREVDLILLVIRDFVSEKVVRSGSTNPTNDIQVLLTELMLADLQQIEKQKTPHGNLTKDELVRVDAISKVRNSLEEGNPASTTILTEKEQLAIKGFGLLTRKPLIVVRNTDENQLTQNTQLGNLPTISLSAKLEADLIDLSIEERKELLSAYGVTHSALDLLIKETFHTLGLISFLTAGVKEVRAWPIPIGTTAPQAAGVIHTDFEKNFVKAKIVLYDDFLTTKGWAGAKELGKVRLEGKDYLMQEGDVVEFMVNS